MTHKSKTDIFMVSALIITALLVIGVNLYIKNKLPNKPVAAFNDLTGYYVALEVNNSTKIVLLSDMFETQQTCIASPEYIRYTTMATEDHVSFSCSKIAIPYE